MHLPRSVANELVLLAVLCPLAVSDISIPHASQIFATDASTERGAVIQAPVEEDVQEALRRACKSKGSYTRLASHQESMLQRIGILESAEDFVEDSPKVDRPLAFKFVFIEVFAGSAKTTRQIDRMGYAVGHPIELSRSEEYNAREVHVIARLTHLLQSGSLLAFICEPPCATFSIMRRP